MQATDATKCPMCGALVDSGAKKCESCGETITATGPGRVRFRLTAQLPMVCAICGETAIKQNRVRFRQSRENLGTPIRLPVCHRHRGFHPLMWHQLLSMILVSPIFIVGISEFVGSKFGFPIGLIAGLALLAALVWLVVANIWESRGPRSPSEDLTHIVLTGVAPEFALACEAIDDREAEQVGDALEQMFRESSQGQS